MKKQRKRFKRENVRSSTSLNYLLVKQVFLNISVSWMKLREGLLWSNCLFAALLGREETERNGVEEVLKISTTISVQCSKAVHQSYWPSYSLNPRSSVSTSDSGWRGKKIHFFKVAFKTMLRDIYSDYKHKGYTLLYPISCIYLQH